MSTMSLQQLPAILTWTEPEKSGVLFAPVLLALLGLCYNSLISVLAYSALALLTLVAGCKTYTYVMVKVLKKLPAEPSSDPLTPFYDINLEVPADSVVNLSAYVTDIVNSGLSELRRLFLAENLLDSAKFGISLYCLTYIGSWFNLLTLVILAWVALFTLPKLYLNNQPAVDDVVEKLKAQVLELQGKVVSFLPAAAKTVPSEEIKKEE